jgi:hypothetical protein
VSLKDDGADDGVTVSRARPPFVLTDALIGPYS